MLDISAQAGGLYVGEFGQPNQLADVYGIKAGDIRGRSPLGRTSGVAAFQPVTRRLGTASFRGFSDLPGEILEFSN